VQVFCIYNLLKYTQLCMLNIERHNYAVLLLQTHKHTFDGFFLCQCLSRPPAARRAESDGGWAADGPRVRHGR